MCLSFDSTAHLCPSLFPQGGGGGFWASKHSSVKNLFVCQEFVCQEFFLCQENDYPSPVFSPSPLVSENAFLAARAFDRHNGIHDKFPSCQRGNDTKGRSILTR